MDIYEGKHICKFNTFFTELQVNSTPLPQFITWYQTGCTQTSTYSSQNKIKNLGPIWHH